MITNNEIKLINSLSRKKERMAHGLFIVEGNKSVAEVLQSDFVVKQIYGVDDEFAHHELYKGVSPKQLERISQYKTATEALALVELPKTQKADVSAPSILLENINDPGNLGTIIRTADWFGIKQVICSDQSVDCFNPKVVTATKGSLFRTKVIYTDLPAFVEQSKLPTVATSLSGSDLSGELDLTGYNVAFGSESHGISPALEAACSSSIRIPSFNSEAESLNLGVSVGVICGFIHLKGK